jgi:Secretion system C-terminal sorting domain/SprB repeat/HYR domain
MHARAAVSGGRRWEIDRKYFESGKNNGLKSHSFYFKNNHFPQIKICANYLSTCDNLLRAFFYLRALLFLTKFFFKMKQYLLVFGLVLSFLGQINAQLPDGTIAPDWTETSITGQSYNLYTMLNQGKVVYLDFSATWCGPCWNYHNTHALRDVYDVHGPAGDNKARVFFIEGDGSTNTACLSGPSGCVGGTQGNWVAGTTYPIIDDNNENTTAAYAIAFFPTIYGVCPMNKLVYEIGQLSAAGLWNWQAAVCPPFMITSNPVVTNVLCFGQTNGAIVQTPTNGVGPYTYQWSNGATTKNLTGLTGGTFSLTITDANANTGVVGPIVVNGPSAPLTVTTFTQTNPGCGGQLGAITVTASGGTADYSYQWSNGGQTAEITGLAPGLYSCTVTDDNNCTKTYQNTLVAPVLPTAAIATPTTLTCTNSQQTLNGNGSSQGNQYTYSWTATGGGNIVSGATTLTPIVNAGGNYSLQVTNEDNNCVKVANTVVSASITPPTANAGANSAITCQNPTRVLTGSGSTGGSFSYQWTATNGGNIVSGSSSLSPTVNAAGTYTLVVTNSANGCTANSATIVTNNSQIPTLAVTGGTLNCTANQVILAANSNQTVSYAWSGPNGYTSILQNPTVDVSGNYALVITNTGSGCTNSATATVVSNTTIPTVSATGGAITCVANNVILAGNSSATGSTFAWAGPDNYTSNLQNPTANLIGAYTVLVTAPNGCTSSAAANISSNTTTPNAAAGNDLSLNCNATQQTLNGSNSSQGNNYLYNWTTTNGNIVSGPNTLTPVVNAAGNYSLQVTNTDNGCTSTDAAIIVANTPPAAAISASQNVACFGGNNGSATVSTTGGNGSFSFVWSNGNTTQTTSNLVAGTYSVTATDGENCAANTTITVTQPSALAANASATAQQNIGQNNGSATANPTGGASNYTYLWSNNQTSQTISNLAPGSYSVVVTDANGCTSSQTVTVNSVGCALAATTSQLNVACFGGNNGSATANVAGANLPVTYLWSNGQTAQTANNLTAGDYSVQILDNAGCPATLAVTIAQPNNLSANASSTNESSTGGNNGSATANPTGGTGIYTYLWSNNATTQTISNLAPGNYSVAVSDANGCISNQNVTIGSFSCALQPTVINTQVSCFNGNNGQSTVTLGGGVAPFSYVWSNGQTTATAQNLAAGQYSVAISDATGCAISEAVIITQPTELAVSAAQTNVQCPSETTGEIVLSVAGGSSNYTFLWSNGATTSTVSNLTAGIYSAIVTDGNGCTASKSATILSNDTQMPQLSIKNIIVPIDDNGIAAISGAAFDDGSTDNCGISTWSVSQNSFDCGQLGAQQVLVTAADANGNSATQSGTVTIVDTKAPTLTCPNSISTGACQPMVVYNYPSALDNCLSLGGQWNQPSGLPSGTAFPIGVTNNTFTYTDASGNVGECSFEVVVLALPSVSANVVNPVSCFGGNNGSVSTAVLGGNAPFSYVWSNGQITETANNLAAGTYSVIVSDASGCSIASNSVVLTSPETIQIQVNSVINDINNAGIGSISISTNGGTAGYSYNWTLNGAPFSDKEDLVGLQMGAYVCVVTDANGCFVSSQTIVVQNSVATSEPNWAKGLLISPNPTSGQLQIAFKNQLTRDFSVQLFDVNGQILRSENFDGAQSTISLNYSDVPTGVYLMAVRNDVELITRRIVITR